MTIMRSGVFWSMSKVRLKRCKFDWYSWLENQEDLVLSGKFLVKYSEKLRSGKTKHVSKNKCAYEVLKSHYSTTALRCIQEFGVPSL